DVNLVGRGADQVVITVARHEVPLIAKIVVKTGNSEVIILGSAHIPYESLNVRAVAAAQTAGRFIRLRHILVPELPHQGVDSDAQRIKGRNVVRHRVPGGIREGEESGAHGRRRHCSLDGGGVGPAEALIIGEEVSLSPQHSRQDGAASRRAKAVVMIVGVWQSVVVIHPGVGVEVVVQIVLVNRAVPGAGAALGDYLHLCARRAVEVGALQGGTDIELLHAIARGRHNTRGSRSHTVTLVGNASRWVTGKAGRVPA